MVEKTYIIVGKKNIYIIEGLYGPQFRHHKSFLMRLLCFMLGLILFRSHSYPNKDIVIRQMFPNIPDDWKERWINIYLN